MAFVAQNVGNCHQQVLKITLIVKAIRSDDEVNGWQLKKLLRKLAP